MKWSELSTFNKFMAIFCSVAAVGGALTVFLWGRV